MKRVAPVIGGILIVVALYFFLQAIHILPTLAFIKGRWAPLGWGAWSLAFGVGFLVWTYGSPAKR